MPESKQVKMNKAKPGVKISLDRERTLRFDLNAMVTFEETTGKSLSEGLFRDGKVSSKDLRAMLWACLVHEDDALTEKQVGSWISMSNIVEIASKLNEAFMVAMPESADKAPLAKSP